MPAPNQPITIQIQHDQVDTSQFDLVITDVGASQVVVSDSKPVDPAGVNFPITSGLPVGVYEAVVTAVGPGGSTASDPVTIAVVPNAPAKPIIIVVVG